jgi:hypothetical protein
MRSKRGMLKPSWSAPALFMALTIAGSPEASARVDPVFPDLQVCTRIFPSACATLVRMEVINANTLEFEVFNSTIITGPGDPLEDSFIGKIIFNFQGAKKPNQIQVQSPTGIDWDVKNQAGGIRGLDWDFKLQGKNGPSDGIGVGETFVFRLTWNAAGDRPDLGDFVPLAGFGANIHGMGPDDISDWAVVPEPVTIVLLGSGLAGLGGAGLLRRRKRGGDLTKG